MRILYLHSSPELRRYNLYYSIASVLQEQYGHEVVFVYMGPQEKLGSTVPIKHFESWVMANTGLIENTDIIELERRFPESNLWLAAAAERRICDYSLLGGAVGWTSYSWKQIIFLLKAAVLFYQSIFREFPCDIVLAQHPDNMHSVLLFELAKSMDYHAVSLYRDYYWDTDLFFLLNDQHYRSLRLTALYKKYISNYETYVQPHEQQLTKFISVRMRNDPAATRPELIPEIRMSHTIRNAVEGFLDKHEFFGIGRRPILEGYWKRDIIGATLALLNRSRNMLWRSLTNHFSTEIPTSPYVLFPLHYQPEAGTLAAAPVFQNQLGVIHAISASLPAGYLLVVKENPKIGGHRSPSFYQQLRQFPNVVLLPGSIPNEPLIQGAAMVITIRGTMGLQALMQGKPVVLLGRKFFDCIDSFMKVNDLNELPFVLKKALVADSVEDDEHRRRCIYAFFLAYQNVLYRRKRVASEETLEQKAASYANMLDRMLRDELGFIRSQGI